MNQAMTICSACSIITFYSSNTEKSKSQQILSIRVPVFLTNSCISFQYDPPDSKSGYNLQLGIDYRTMHQLRNNKNITAHTIEKLCRILDCTPNDILTFTNDDTK